MILGVNNHNVELDDNSTLAKEFQLLLCRHFGEIVQNTKVCMESIDTGVVFGDEPITINILWFNGVDESRVTTPATTCNNTAVDWRVYVYEDGNGKHIKMVRAEELRSNLHYIDVSYVNLLYTIDQILCDLGDVGMVVFDATDKTIAVKPEVIAYEIAEFLNSPLCTTPPEWLLYHLLSE